MDQKQKDYFASMEQLFKTPGWALLEQGWQAELDNLPMAAFFNAKTFEELVEYRIRFELVNELTQLPQLIEAQKAEAEVDE